MIVGTSLIIDKINELEQEMKIRRLWLSETPGFANYFEEKTFSDGKDFAQWLQYVFIPNHKKSITFHSNEADKKFIVLQAMKFFGKDIMNGKLLQLLIEIDSLV